MNYAKMFAEGKAKALLKDVKIQSVKIKSKISELEKTDLGDINGIGESTKKTLLENGISSIAELKEGGMEKINEIEKINPLSLRSIKKFLETSE